MQRLLMGPKLLVGRNSGIVTEVSLNVDDPNATPDGNLAQVPDQGGATPSRRDRTWRQQDLLRAEISHSDRSTNVNC